MFRMSSLLILLVITQLGLGFGTDGPTPKATWTDFQSKHILNPNLPSEAWYRTWGREKWNSFLKERIPEYGTKPINSFIIGDNSTILDDFKDGYYQVEKHDGTGIGNNRNLHWSSSKFQVYVMTLENSSPQIKDYDVYNCGTEFVLAAIELGSIMPVHYAAQSKFRQKSGAVGQDLSVCKKILATRDPGSGFPNNRPSLLPLAILLTVYYVVKKFVGSCEKN